MKKLLFIVVLLLVASNFLFSQEYEIAWQKDMPQMSYAQFSKDGQFIYCAVGNEIWKYNSTNGEFVSKFDNSGFAKIGTDFYGNFYMSNSGNYLIGICDQYYNVWDTKTEKAYFQFSDVFGGLDITNDDSKYIAIKRITTENDRIVLLDSKTQKEIKSFTTNQNVILTKLSHNGKMFATASISGSKYYLTLWNTETLTENKRFQLDGYSGTQFKEIKFSWDDKYVGVRTNMPYEVNIFNTFNLSKYLSSKIYDTLSCSSFDFISTRILFYYINTDDLKGKLILIDEQTQEISQSFDILTQPLSTSSNNLIFTGKALLKPKTVGVNEPKLPNSELSISPNPAGDYVEISYSPSIKRGLGGVSSSVIPAYAGISIEIFNVFGEKITTPSNLSGLTPLLAKEGIIKIDVSKLPVGVYFIRIGDKFEKFIKW
jgi:hypothetical protein